MYVGSYLEPKAGFSSATSWTDDVVFLIIRNQNRGKLRC